MFNPFDIGSLFMLASSQPEMLAQVLGQMGLPPPTAPATSSGGDPLAGPPGMAPFGPTGGGFAGNFSPPVPLQAPLIPDATAGPLPSVDPFSFGSRFGGSVAPAPVSPTAAPVGVVPLPGGPEDVDPLALAGSISGAGAPAAAGVQAPTAAGGGTQNALKGLALAGQALKGGADTRPQFTGGVTPQRQVAPVQAGGAQGSAVAQALLQSLLTRPPTVTTPSLGALLGGR